MDNATIEKRVEELLSKMTIREKLGQLTQVGCEHASIEINKERMRKGELGSFIANVGHFGPSDNNAGNNNRKYMNELQRVAVEESRLGIPMLIGKDVIHGHNTVFPVPLAMAASFDPDLVEECYTAISAEAANDGIHWSFSPMVDLARDPRWGRCVEGIGEDPYLGSKMAAAAVRGFQGDDLSKRENIAACAKHYIGYGAMEGGRDYQKSEISDYTLRNFYLPSFKSAVEAGCATVMSAFNEISGESPTSSHYLLTELLRDELGFDGFVVSDYNSVIQLRKQGLAETKGDAASMSITAGVDMDMADMAYIDTLEAELEAGKVEIEVINEAVRRVLRIKFKLGLFENPYVEFVPVDTEKHKALARKIAQESMVLLKNDNNILPLKKEGNLFISGDYQRDHETIFGAWTLDGVAEWAKTLEEAIREAAPEVNLCSETNHNAKVQYANFKRWPDTVVFVFGTPGWMDGEASSFSELELTADQIAAVQKAKSFGKKAIGVFFCGRPRALGNVDYLFDAILWGWHCGTETCTAAADILFGDVNPSGKLSMTLPRATGQVPIYYNHNPSCRKVDEYYGILGEYENYRDLPGSPLYPFGYGISYTTYSYTDPETDCDKIALEDILSGKSFKIKTKLTNTGMREGTEVAQCYVRDNVASMIRPIRALEGFERVTLNAGETKEVVFTLGEKELGFYGKDSKFTVEKGKFTVYVGTNSQCIQSLTIEVI